jgi:hypothetical protein
MIDKTLHYLFPFIFLFVASCSSLPKGQTGEAAEKLTQRILAAADYEKWKATTAVTFLFRGDDRIFWDKKRKLVEVLFKKNLVQFSEVTGKSLCFEGERRLFDECGELTAAAVKRFYNHTYWLNPAFHIDTPNAVRAIAEENKLLVTFNSGGATPGDSYLFTTDEEGKLSEMRMWVSTLPLKGAKATFGNYQTTATGVRVALDHKVASLASVNLSELQMFATYPEAGRPDRFQGLLELAGGPGSESLNRKK